MKKLLLFTDGFPYDPGETPFLYNELCELTKHYDVDIVANVHKEYAYGDICIELPNNVRAYKHVIEDIGRKEKIIYMPRVEKTQAWKLEKKQLKSEKKSGLDVYEDAITYMVRTLIYFDWILNNLNLNQYDICYTYWNSYATLAMAIYKEKNPELKLITRTHGYDLFNERTRYNHQYYKTYIDALLDKVFFIAENGRKYYLDHFANIYSEDKYVFNAIGCVRAKTVPIREDSKDKSEQFILVSCSSVIPLKRVNLIVEALACIEGINIRWTHLGGGSQLEEIKLLCAKLLDEKENIQYELKGWMDNKTVRQFYDSTYIDCFITTSSTEGSPVSVQEALAYGIPVIGTDVGEIPTLIDNCGIVIGVQADKLAVAKAILDMADMNDEQMNSYRNTAYKRWQEQFNAKANSQRFVEIIKEL